MFRLPTPKDREAHVAIDSPSAKFEVTGDADFVRHALSEFLTAFPKGGPEASGPGGSDTFMDEEHSKPELKTGFQRKGF